MHPSFGPPPDPWSHHRYHQQLTDCIEDQLSLAAIHYLRGHFQEATDIYKRLLLENRDDLALNLCVRLPPGPRSQPVTDLPSLCLILKSRRYVAMCYYKLDYYDVSLEILAVYLQAHPDSVVALSLKACNHFRLYSGKAAEAELKTIAEQGTNITENDLIRHNLVVFRGGENALQVLPPLVDFIPEARLNLVVYYLRNDEIQEAFELMKDLEPSTPQVRCQRVRAGLHPLSKPSAASGLHSQRRGQRCHGPVQRLT